MIPVYHAVVIRCVQSLNFSCGFGAYLVLCSIAKRWWILIFFYKIWIFLWYSGLGSNPSPNCQHSVYSPGHDPFLIGQWMGTRENEEKVNCGNPNVTLVLWAGENGLLPATELKSIEMGRVEATGTFRMYLHPNLFTYLEQDFPTVVIKINLIWFIRERKQTKGNVKVDCSILYSS